MPLYEYVCEECEEYFTAMKPVAERDKADCPHCSGTGSKILSKSTFKLDGTDPGFPGAWSKWEKKRAEKLAQEQKARREHGDGL